MPRSPRRRALTIVAILLLLALGSPAFAQTKSEVDRTRQAMEEALEQLRADQARFDAAVAEYQRINGELEDVTFKVLRFTADIDEFEREVGSLEDIVEQRAVEAYMDGGATLVELVLNAGSLNSVLAGQEFLARAAEEDTAALDRLAATRGEMDRIRDELRVDEERLKELRAAAERISAELEEIAEASRTKYQRTDAAFHAAYEAFQKEQERKRLAELARLRGAAAGASAAATAGFVCPMKPPYSFINDWGFPRSGGRTHKGNDIFGPMGHPVYAVVNGTVRLSYNRLGGTSVHLTASNGTRYYYAHLSGYASGISSGSRVSAGQLVGYNGNSGNAVGGSPHVHFQIHPGGGAPVNPYPTLVQACR